MWKVKRVSTPSKKLELWTLSLKKFSMFKEETNERGGRGAYELRIEKKKQHNRDKS